jgi:uncharacterized protein
MSGETNLNELLKNMKPHFNEGEFVFCTIKGVSKINLADVVMTFKEAEGTTLIMTKEHADELKLPYSVICSWITLTIHSSLEAVGLTAAFSQALAKENVSCNVVAAFHHDHLFVPQVDAHKAMQILHSLSANSK